MNAEIKSQWVDALRSGKYTQGHHALRESVGGQVAYCCLGVLCEIAAEAGIVKVDNDLIRSEFGVTIQTAFDGSVAYLPESVSKWSGVGSYNGVFATEGDSRQTLTALNDTGLSFDEIADTIEAKF